MSFLKTLLYLKVGNLKFFDCQFFEGQFNSPFLQSVLTSHLCYVVYPFEKEMYYLDLGSIEQKMICLLLGCYICSSKCKLG